VPDVRRIAINNDLDIVAARVEGRNMAKEMGFGIIDQARIATAISELARNVVLYARSGLVILRQITTNNRVGIEIVCEDEGHGIADVDAVMRDEHSTAQGLGMGLRGTKRLMDGFEIRSQLGRGTTVIVRKWLP
jgi:serine/threonine-protein kinase RsbT